MGGNTLKKYSGFSMIELMVVVAIVGVLAAIVLPNYRSYVLKSHRTAAINAIMDAASREARYYTTHNTYATDLTTLGYAVVSSMPVPATGTAFYTLSVAASATAFTLSATPTTPQATDTCGTYTYTDMGAKGSGGSLSDCWKQ
jgi:type IV pilus assembly protein PilE